MYKIFKHRKLPRIPLLGEMHIKLQWYKIFTSLFSFFCFCNATFFHSGYVIKPPLFTKLRVLQGTQKKKCRCT